MCECPRPRTASFDNENVNAASTASFSGAAGLKETAALPRCHTQESFFWFRKFGNNQEWSQLADAHRSGVKVWPLETAWNWGVTSANDFRNAGRRSTRNICPGKVVRL